MKRIYSAILCLSCLLTTVYSVKAQKNQNLKPRMVVLTDIAPNDIEPDDTESMIRLLAHADLFEIEALVATTGWSNTGGRERIDLIHGVLNAYEKDLPNLRKRSSQLGFLENESRQEIGYWPSPAYLRSRTVLGSTKMGIKSIGEGNDSEGSKRIIALADENDSRPIWISVWGGGNTFAQAVWRVQKDRTPEELSRFLNKFRVYTITDQDRPWSQGDTIPYSISAHQWLRKFGKDLKFFWDESAWKHHNETGKRNWDQYAAHIQGHGNLGSLYPKYKWGLEGDTPAFLHIMPTGLSDPDAPEQVSWSGYFNWGPGPDSVNAAYTNHKGEAYETASTYFAYFYPASFNSFAARMDWAKDGKGNRNPTVVVNGKKGLGAIEIVAAAGKKIKLDASKSSDPDGDQLQYKWWIIPEAGTYKGNVQIVSSESSEATVHIPTDAGGKKFHVICEVRDTGTHPLSSYRRIIFSLK